MFLLQLSTRYIETAAKENIEDLLFEQCYCPGDEYAYHIPELNEVIMNMAREYGKSAKIYRLPTQPKEGIPDVGILKSIQTFSQLSREELLDVDYLDMVKLAAEAQERVYKMIINLIILNTNDFFFVFVKIG